MMRPVLLFSILLAGCASMVPSDPQAARAKLARDLRVDAGSITSVIPCIFAVTAPYITRAQFTECAFVETQNELVIARALNREARFEKAIALQSSSIKGYNTRNWGLGASQLQLFTEKEVITVHLKSGGMESMDRPEETGRIAALLRARGVPSAESPGRVDQIPSGTVVAPVFVPTR
jgi:hypothetical protein